MTGAADNIRVVKNCSKRIKLKTKQTMEKKNMLKLYTKYLTVKDRFVNDERGQGLVEYALIVALISIAAVLVMPQVGTQVAAAFQRIVTALTPVAG